MSSSSNNISNPFSVSPWTHSSIQPDDKENIFTYGIPKLSFFEQLKKNTNSSPRWIRRYIERLKDKCMKASLIQDDKCVCELPKKLIKRDEESVNNFIKTMKNIDTDLIQLKIEITHPCNNKIEFDDDDDSDIKFIKISWIF